MANKLKQFSESAIGILLFSIIPAVLGYISVVEKVKFSTNFNTNDNYYPLYVSVIVYVGAFLILIARKQIIKFKRDQDARFNELEETLARKASSDAALRNLTEINKLWEESNKVNRQVSNVADITNMNTKTLSTTVRGMVAYINSHQTADDVAKIRDILYDKATIPEYQEIGISEDILNAMRERYYSESREVYQDKLSHLNQAKNSV